MAKLIKTTRTFVSKINLFFIFTLLSALPVHGMERVDNSVQQEREQLVNQDQVTLIEEHIKKACKEYGASLTYEIVGESLKHYAQEDKDAVLKKLMKLDMEMLQKYRFDNKKIKQCVKDHYEAIRLSALILICAGADPTIKLADPVIALYAELSLLDVAVEFNDMQMVKKLCEYKVDLNAAHYNAPFTRPLLLSATTKEMAQILIDNGINLHNVGLREGRAMRTMLGNKFPSELIEFYLEKGVGQTESDNFCWDFLSELTSKYQIKNVDNAFKKAEFLCKAMPQDEVNKVDGRYTLIDRAQWRLECNRNNSSFVEFYEKLITLYRQRGGLTASELYKKLALQAEEYNQTNPTLSALPQEILFDIFSYYQAANQKQKESCGDSIKNFMRLRGACRKFNRWLTPEVMSNWCKNYGQHDKDKTLEKIVRSIEPDRYSNIPWHDYTTRRLPALILVCAGADPNINVENSKYLLKHAADHNDAQMVKILFKHKVDPYKNNDTGYGSYGESSKKSPLLMCKTREIAQIFLDNKVTVSDDTYPNVLWCILGDKYPADLMSCYLENGLDATELHHDRYEKNKTMSLLHHIASHHDQHELKNSNQLLEKAQFLLDALPKEMVNSLYKKKTPIDIAQNNSTRERTKKGPLVEFYEKLICLYRQYGGLSGFALSKKSAVQAKQHNCAQPLVHIMSQANIYPIFSFCQEHEQNQAESLTKSIKSFMQLRTTCKQLNESLTAEVIGNLCKDYTQDDKNKALEKVGSSLGLGWHNIKHKQFSALILVCAGADPNIKVSGYCKDSCLLGYAVDENDQQMVAALFKHKVHLNVTNPALYKTKEIAQLFIDNGVDVKVPVDDFPNVLWHVVGERYPADLLEFYLEKGVDPRQLSSYDYYGSKQDLLCYLTDGERDSHGDYGRDKIKKAKLLVKAMPEKINTVWGWRTLVDIAQDKYGEYKADGFTYSGSFYEELIALYKKHGGLTAEELQQ